MIQARSLFDMQNVFENYADIRAVDCCLAARFV